MNRGNWACLPELQPRVEAEETRAELRNRFPVPMSHMSLRTQRWSRDSQTVMGLVGGGVNVRGPMSKPDGSVVTLAEVTVD